MTPSRTALIVVGGWGGLGVAVAFLPGLLNIWQGLGALLAATALADAYAVRRAANLRISREIKHTLAVGAWNKVAVAISNAGARTLSCVLHDHHPEHFEVDDMPRTLILTPSAVSRIVYRVRPRRRGGAQFPGVDLLFRSPLHLWRHRRYYPKLDSVRVYPNFSEISRYTLLATDNKLSQLGVRRRQRRGEGNDFLQLREYRPGDALRQIDWKATARSRKMISKEYQDERDQQILFLIDCGRRMRHSDAERAHLDQALNAMLLLSYVAVQQGDAVGFLSFAGTKRWFPPTKGGATVSKLLNQTYDLQSSTEPADYLLAAQELIPLQRKRALLIVLTSTRDEDHSVLQAAVKLLRRKHLVVVADLREETIDEKLRRPVHDLDSALRFHAVLDYLEVRRKSHEGLTHHGAMILDLLPRQLPIALVNEYFAIKRMGTL
jgi:uncharacterized protein (DUF58 family)